MITESDLTLNYELGIVATTEGLVTELNNRSGEAFANRRDEEAKFLRKLADEFKDRAAILRKDFNAKRDKITES